MQRLLCLSELHPRGPLQGVRQSRSQVLPHVLIRRIKGTARFLFNVFFFMRPTLSRETVQLCTKVNNLLLLEKILVLDLTNYLSISGDSQQQQKTTQKSVSCTTTVGFIILLSHS